MEWTAVIALVLLGLLLIVVEIVFVPGTTIIALLGVAGMVGGVFLAFSYFGSATGWAVLIISSLFGLVLIIYSLRSGVWKKFALGNVLSSKVNEEFKQEFQVGEVGEALSDLRPIGKGDFSGREIEIRSLGEHLDAGSKIQIIKVQGNKIYVEPYQK